MLPVWAWVALGVGGVAVVSSGGGGGGRMPKRAKRDGIKVQAIKILPQGDAPNSFEGAQQAYIKSLGTKRFYVGACFDPYFTDDLPKRFQRDGSKTPANLDEWIMQITAIFSAPAAVIVDWLKKRGCLRLKADMRAYEFDGTRYWAVDTMEVGDLEMTFWDGHRGDALEGIVSSLQRYSPMELPKKGGYKRVWVLPEWPAGTRNENARMVVWAMDGNEGKKAVMQELVPEVELRRMLLMLSSTGAFTREDLPGDRHWAPSVKSQVKNEYPGLGDD